MTRTRSRNLLTSRYPVDDTFANHDHRCMGAARPGDARHHRCVSHPQLLNTLHSAVLVDDRHRVRVRSHPTSPGYMPGRAHGLADPEIQSVVVGQNVSRRVDPVIDHVFKCVGFQQSRRQSQAFPHPSNVVSMLEITIVEGRLDTWGRPRPTGHILSRRATPACTRSAPPAPGEHHRSGTLVRTPGTCSCRSSTTGLVLSTISLTALDPGAV